jgi:hypothetical protein
VKSLTELYERIIVTAAYSSYSLPHHAGRQHMDAANRRWRATVAAYARHHPEELSRFRRHTAAALRQTTTVDGVVTEVSTDHGMTFATE